MTTARTGWLARYARLVILLVSLPLTSAGALPAWAALFGVEGPHICHCADYECHCVRCHTESDDPTLLVSSESLKGRCGEDDISFGSRMFVGLTGPDLVASIASPLLGAAAPPALHAPYRSISTPPDPPPPRSMG